MDLKFVGNLLKLSKFFIFFMFLFFTFLYFFFNFFFSQAAFKKLQELGFNHNNFGDDLSKFNNYFDEGNLNNGNFGNKDECENDILNNFYKCEGNFLSQFNNYIINDKPNNLFEFYMNQSQNFNYVNPFNYYSRPSFSKKNKNNE